MLSTRKLQGILAAFIIFELKESAFFGAANVWKYKLL